MTIIAGIIDSGRILLGADSAVSNENFIENIADSKLIRKSSIIIGFCSSLKIGQIIKYNFEPPPIKNKKTWLHIDFLSELKSSIEKHTKDKPELIIGFDKKLYHLQEDYSLVRSKHSFVAIGSGSEYAYGAFHATKDRYPRDRLRLALEAAAKFNPQCAAPFSYATLED